MQDKFLEAMALVGKAFAVVIYSAKLIWWPGRVIVEEAIKKRYEVIFHFHEASHKETTLSSLHYLTLFCDHLIISVIRRCGIACTRQ